MPLIAWVVTGVAAVHLAAFWFLAGKHFLPKVQHVPPPSANFASGKRTLRVDPVTGEKTTETDFVVSTRLRPAPAK